MHQEHEDNAVDEDLLAEVMQYLTITPPDGGNCHDELPTQKNGRQSAAKSGTKAAKGRVLSLDEFVTLTYPLLDLEKAAEIAQVIPSLLSRLALTQGADPIEVPNI